jgi:ankyrin repeat protein
LFEAVSNKSKKVAKILSFHQGGFCMSSMEFAIFLNKIIKSGDLQMLQLALANGTSVNCADYDERTPLHVAGDLGFSHIYDFLIARGADVNKKDRFGQIPRLSINKKPIL